jgi:uncharacterized membrane protein YbhN (UPF0104 family)
VAALAILVGLAWRLGAEPFVAGLRLIDAPAVLAALGIGLATTWFSAMRWRLIAGGMGLRLPAGTALADYYRSLFLNAVLPAGVLGDAHRAYRHGRRSGDLGRGVQAVVMERVVGQIVLAALVVVALLVLPVPVPAPRGPDSAVPWVAAAGLGALVVVTALWWGRSRFAARWRGAAGRILAEVRRGLAPRLWPGVLVLSAAAVAGHLALFLVAARTAEVTAPVPVQLALMLPALLVMALPVNVGGWGPREGFLAAAFGACGLGAAQGLTTAVVFGVLAFAASLPGAVLLLRRAERTRREDP